ncbi:hypothetical protein FL966_07460 [Caproiciproducens galactitolivorans]|uniref:Glucosamine-6-phosphate deaminase 1 n=1 Tax=Caproiciproducens galactitolivorans TaxID=642589 RepID=A0A4Z0YC54_9FIRM|nr:hypothetical protein [Caproiciproducens galactitolivorans]QEY34896.1 hypothetical protein FL966_07460 [Caproiciproducens galactitolivorans]TGJ76403.1 glucosamine-6-phosphate deaminase 1 [Caproiciproducens galactitolivorans]
MKLQDKKEETSSPNTDSTGMPPKTVICDDFEAMSQYCADLICGAVKKKPDLLLCLAAGNTAIRTYQILKKRSGCGQTDFSRAEFVELDEWLDLDDESENVQKLLRVAAH